MRNARRLNGNGGSSSAPESGASVEVRLLQHGEEDDWDAYVRASSSATFFHLSGWRTVVREVLGHRCFCLIARTGGRITGVFPISWIRSRIFGDCMVSMPLAVYGGICADDRESYSELLRAASGLAAEHKVKYLEMRNRTEPYPTELPRRDLYVTFIQDLTSGPEKLLQSLPRDTRYMVRKSQKMGLEWVEDLPLNEFYEIYARSVHHLGTPVFARSLFTRLRSEFSKETRVFGVRKDGQAIAGVFCFYFRDQVLPYYGGSLAEFNRDAPNNFMYWNLMAQSSQEGYRQFDFGRSKRGTGSYSFKSSWGIPPVELPYQYQLVRAREVPHMSPIDRKFRAPVSLWKRLPFAWTKVLGPRVIRWIPSV